MGVDRGAARCNVAAPIICIAAACRTNFLNILLLFTCCCKFSKLIYICLCCSTDFCSFEIVTTMSRIPTTARRYRLCFTSLFALFLCGCSKFFVLGAAGASNIRLPRDTCQALSDWYLSSGSDQKRTQSEGAHGHGRATLGWVLQQFVSAICPEQLEPCGYIHIYGHVCLYIIPIRPACIILHAHSTFQNLFCPPSRNRLGTRITTPVTLEVLLCW